ncbi:GerAB/ArcD/ProY family transporter [Crassaminicella thermophila]|uniref:GerAB/ArcD/ProY family transporter n=1 Tax=Crassaminicella thermophila TaxID=2599308 RepID=A0A5C0SBC6_CRATE|nr:endospore germination permease [Crassaminicella thermophila]QEK11222.1 GerAB/ArcD/ProY family transporter [Crassaminicella thermophila]
MNKEVISEYQGISLLTMFIIGSSLVLPTATEAGSDSWLAIILALFFSLPIACIYVRVFLLSSGNDLFDAFIYVFGKIFGKIICLLYIWFSFHLGSLVIRDFGEFPITVSMPETPLIVFMGMITFLSIWAVKEGIEALGRWGSFFFIISIVFFFMAVFMLIPEMDLDNIQPVLYKGIKPVLRGSFSTFSFPFAETIVFLLSIFSLKSKKNYCKAYIKGLLIGGIVLVIAQFTQISVLGEHIYGATYFPGRDSVSKIDIGNFIQRVEIIAFVALFIPSFVKLCICLLAASNGIIKLFNLKDYRFIVVPISLCMLNLSYLINDNLMSFAKWTGEIWPYYAFLFQVIIPVITWIAIEIKTIRKNRFI